MTRRLPWVSTAVFAAGLYLVWLGWPQQQSASPAATVEVSQAPQVLIESPGARRLGPELPYHAVRMSMGSSKRVSIPVPGETESARMSVSLDAHDREVSVLWSHGDSKELFGSPKRALYLHYPVGFAAASIAPMPDGRLLISGVDDQAWRPIFEVWTFETPELIEDESGKPSLTEPGIIGRERVAAHRGDRNYGVAQAIWTSESIGNHRAWIYTYPEADIRELDLLTGRTRLMLSPTESVGDLTPSPRLEDQWDSAYYWGRHKTCGDCYLLSLVDCIVPSAGTLLGLILMDRSRDGLIDSYEPLFSGLKLPEGLDDQESWIGRPGN